MDEGLSRAVAKVFVELYRSGLIYRDKRLVNWDPKLKTAISDLEVQQVEVKGHLWHIKYPIEGSDEFIIVATTRPETMLGDVAVAVHPENERLKHLIGKTAILPLVGRRIPIIGDDYADPEKGTGAVKITPAHDFNDFEVGRRHELPIINVFDAEARLDLHDNALFLDGVRPTSQFAEAIDRLPRAIRGSIRWLLGKVRLSHLVAITVSKSDLNRTLAMHALDRSAARTQIVERLEAKGLIAKIEPNVQTVPHGDRSGAVVEPFLTDQWYVDAKTLAQPAIEAVRARKTVFVPAQWEATFFNWMENIQPWCISRQIWWGHQIPAWYGPDGKVFVAESEDDAVADALAHYTDIEEITVEEGHDIAADPERRARFANEYLHRDEDVLDTWFSSALWPFSTLGWPDDDAGAETLLPDQCARHRLRHHLFLGRAHDDDGAALYEESAVPHRLYPRARARRARAEDVEVERQRHRSARSHRRVRRRCAALHARRHGRAGPRHQAFRPARRGLSQFCDQALERGALCGNERLRARSGFHAA